MSSGVYRIQIGENFYYGSSKNLKVRCRTHERELAAGTHGNVRMQRAWDKHQDFTFEVLVECSPDDLLRVEQCYLTEFYTDERCMNLTGTAGSPKGYRHTDEARERISASSTGRTHTVETKTRIAAAHQGMRHSEESKAKMRKPKSPEQVARLYGNTYATALKGMKMSAEAVETNRRSHIGLKYSEESKRKRRETWERKRAEGYVSPNRGRPKSS